MADLNADFKPADAASRERIVNNLDENLFVEAGAGTGKTTALVGRIVNLIKKGRTTIGRLAAITFTEMAAAELRDRVRHELEMAAADAAMDARERGRCLEATRHGRRQHTDPAQLRRIAAAREAAGGRPATQFQHM
jgi:ATP-dependent helicase/nuclease subunit A